ncbi:hypothetical protein [Microvirga arsenatis]|uniref:Uncharacterized protein n=1 Tax=Microvirga arsenatis TaxID=2692265 RepID=A0ABW9YWF5_9HYPH|nr:hypothetical protein [Microvirga arsenatis]NBJ10128.1 hypothetical protein [Microvirga arsenatis]NBJ23196.1 hypothetical protein [Microvirga arsenatis]
MFDNVVQASEAFRESAHRMQGSLRMALKGCPECRTVDMIASPSLGACEDCGSAMIALPR